LESMKILPLLGSEWLVEHMFLYSWNSGQFVNQRKYRKFDISCNWTKQ
jgi:hypothetical protein